MEPITLRDFLDFSYPCSLELSPDKKNGAFLVKRPNEEKNSYDSDLYCFDAAEKTVRQMTGTHDISSFFWLSDTEILFTSDRNPDIKKKKEEHETWTVFYKLSIHGGEALEYMRIAAAVNSIKKISDASFALTAVYNPARPDIEHMTGDEKAKAAKEFKDEGDYAVLDEIPFWSNGMPGTINKVRERLYLYDRNIDQLTPVTSPVTAASLFDVKGDKILFGANTYTDKMERLSDLCEYDIKTSEISTLLKDSRLYTAGYFPDSIWVLSAKDLTWGMNTNPDFFICRDGALTPLYANDESAGNSIGSDSRLGANSFARTVDGAVYYMTTDRCHSFLQKLTPDGVSTRIVTEPGSVDGFDVGGGEVYIIAMRGSALQEIYAVKDGSETPVTTLNKDVFEGKYVGVPQHFTYERDGWELDGFVIEPKDYDKSKKYPAILDIHGGPKTAYGIVYYHEMQIWASAGYFVIYCNPRGSDGRGSEFADIRGKYGTGDYEDIMMFVDEALKRYPAIDADRVGVTGGSYGGFMTNWIIGHTDRFKAAASQRSIANWVSFSYTTDIGYFFGLDQIAATPWSDIDLVWKQSPMRYADKVKTPTLFIHSEQDYRCWMAEGLQMFTALKFFGVPSRLCLFYGENHELSRSGKPKHRIRRLKEISDWMDAYLKA